MTDISATSETASSVIQVKLREFFLGIGPVHTMHLLLKLFSKTGEYLIATQKAFCFHFMLRHNLQRDNNILKILSGTA